MHAQRYVPEPWSPQATRPTHRNPEADEALCMERGKQTIFFACLRWTLLQSDCVYYFSKREQEALVRTHILSSFKNGGGKKKKIIFHISETYTQRHTPHLHPKQLLKLFYTAAVPLGKELKLQPLPQQGISAPVWARSLCFLPRSLTHQPESLSQPTTACPRCKAAASRSSSGAWWQSRQRHMVAGMGPRRAQSSLASDIWEHKDFFMKK